MASSVFTRHTLCEGALSRGPQLRTLEAAESSALLLERCRVASFEQKSLAASWHKRRSKLGAIMQATGEESPVSGPGFAAIGSVNLPFGKKAAAVAPEPETQTHVVQRGQVMSKIAQLYQTDLKTLHELNPGVALDYVRPKQTIIVPKVRSVGAAGAAIKVDAPEICPPKGPLPPSKSFDQARGGFFGPSPGKAPAQPTPAAAAETAAIPVETTSGELQYIVKPGDSLFTIAEQYGVSMTELVKLNRLHFKSTIRPQQAIRIPANSRPQAAVTASVCPAPEPICPAPSRKPQAGWALGVGLALLGAAVAVYAVDFVRKGKVVSGEGSQPPANQAPPAAEITPVTERISPQADRFGGAGAATPFPIAAPVVTPPKQAASSTVGGGTANTIATAPQQTVATPPAPPALPFETPAASTVADPRPTPISPSQAPAPRLPFAAPLKLPPTASETSPGPAAEALPVVSPDAILEETEQNAPVASAPADAVSPVVETPIAAAPEVATSAVGKRPVLEATPSAVIEEEAQNGAVTKDLRASAMVNVAASEEGAGLADILPDELVPLETVDVAGKQPQSSNGHLGVGSSFCQEPTITRALQGAYRAASQSLGPLHQTLAFVALSSGRIGLASQDFTWGSTAEAVVALRATLPGDCNLQGICTWGVSGADGNGVGRDEGEKEWAAVLLFSALGKVVSSGSTITTGSPRLAAEMAAEGLRAKAVGKKLKAVIIVSSPQADAAAIEVVRDVIPGLPVYAISESKAPASPGRPVALSKEWQVAPAGAASAVAPGISLVGITTEANFGGAFFATIVGQWLYGPKCSIEALPPTVSRQMAASGR